MTLCIDDRAMRIKARKDLDNFKKKHDYRTFDEANIAGVMTIIRNEIDSLHDEMPWPPQPQHLAPNCLKIPQKLDLMLSVLFQSRTGLVRSNRERLKFLFAQDIVYDVSNGKQIAFIQH